MLIVFVSLLFINSQITTTKPKTTSTAPPAFQIPSYFQQINQSQLPSNALAVPYVNQTDKPYCGPASLTMVLRYWGYNVSLQDVANAVYNSSISGTTTGAMLSYGSNFSNLTFSQGFGFLPQGVDNSAISSLQSCINAGVPVIVEQNFTLSSNSMHFRVVIGYTNDSIIVQDPDLGLCSVSNTNFMALWQSSQPYADWGMMIMPKYSWKYNGVNW